MGSVFFAKHVKSVVCALGLCLGAGFAVPVVAHAAPALPPGAPPGAQGQIDTVHPEQQFEEPTKPKSGPVDLQIPEGSSAADEQFEEIKLHLSQVKLEGSTVFPEQVLQDEFASLLNQDVSLADVYRIAEKITAKYRDAGYVLSRALIPAQEISKVEGVVRVTVLEGFVQRIVVEAADDAGENAKEKLARVEDRIHRYVDRILESKPLNIRDLERYLLLANDMSGVSAKAVLRPDPKVSGATDLVLKVNFFSYSGSIGLDSMGSRIVGPEEGMIKGRLNSPLGMGEHIELTSVTASPFKDAINLKYGGAVVELPLGDEGARLKLDATRSVTKPGERLKPLKMVSDTETFALSGIYPVIRGRATNLILEGGVKSMESDVDVLERPFNVDKLRKWFFKGSFDHADSWDGVNLFMVQWSHGYNVDAATQKGSLLSSRAEADPNYQKLDGEISRLQGLPHNFSLLAAAMWQYAWHPLFSLEEMGVGGEKYGRGYDLGDITGDKGVAEKVELQYNDEFATNSTYQLYTFLDHGHVWNLDKTDQGTNREIEDITSSGVGVRGTYQKWVNFDLFAAKPMAKIPVNATGDETRWFGRMSINF
ncbi:MAG: ShlB/FhaC/HecB family hemolysin secretion/activation protein [Magnetococcales bacterium]|nr:ShlB/FhaC/HecB family hemolysin secretion/activation protein [Magnetococcales bacterium]